LKQITILLPDVHVFFLLQMYANSPAFYENTCENLLVYKKIATLASQ
jgi:hypothetical protein